MPDTAAEHAQVMPALRMRPIMGKGQSGIESHFNSWLLYHWLKWPKKALASTYVWFHHSHHVYMVLVVIAGFVRMRVMSLKLLNVVMKHLRGRHEKHTTHVGGFIGWGVKEQCTRECCGVCLCDYIGGWGWGGGRANTYACRRENAITGACNWYFSASLS